MSIHKTEAIVLNKYDFRETSVIANFYTRDFGKLSGLLKGIKADPVKFASTLEPFSHNEIIFYRKRNSSLHLVSQCDNINNFSAIREAIPKVGASVMITEMLNMIMPAEDKNEDIFNLALESLDELQRTDNPDKIGTIFKIKTLALSGFKPHLDSCLCCDAKILGESRFSLKQGGLLCTKCCAKDLAARSIFRGTVASILHIEKNDFRSALTLGMNPEIKKELNMVLSSFLKFHLEKDLKSERVLSKMDDAVALAK
jgi:DNA repair protein RecO (recombination protein O)